MDAPNNGNMFFWFFPAAESPETAPVVIWLQVRVTTIYRVVLAVNKQLKNSKCLFLFWHLPEY